VRALEKLARTAEPASAEPVRDLDRLEARAGPVRALEKLAQNGYGAKQFLIRLEVRAEPFARL